MKTIHRNSGTVEDLLILSQKHIGHDTAGPFAPLPYRRKSGPKNGLLALDVLKSEYNVTTPIIAITGYNDLELSDIVLDKGAYYFLNKRFVRNIFLQLFKNSTRFQMSGFDVSPDF